MWRLSRRISEIALKPVKLQAARRLAEIRFNMKFIAQIIALISLIVVGVGFSVTLSQVEDTSHLMALDTNPDRGELVFHAAGCASCHISPGSGEKSVLAGGTRFASDFGTFFAPNISQDSNFGIGAWDVHMFAAAVRQGLSPDGNHYYPAFPYSSYARMSDQDLVDLFIYMKGLPNSSKPSLAHEVGFPFNIRRAVGFWKARYLTDDWVMDDIGSAQLERGRYLVESLSHCAECHTPRDILGGLDRSNWMGGAPNPSGDGRIPNIRPEALGWTALEITDYLETGFTPEFDVAGGTMKAVVENYAKLPTSDREAVAAYLVSIR